MNIEKIDLSVCVLAYNEEKYIAATINSILNSSPELNFNVLIYANGCTDKTYEIAQQIAMTNQRVVAHNITMASKTNAWNEAFKGCHSQYIIFSDGDVILEKEAIKNLYNDLLDDKIIITTSRSFPNKNIKDFEKKMVGFMQLPLKHEFLYGGLYGLNRSKLKLKLEALGLAGLPTGITGEDCFLEFILNEVEFKVSRVKTFYEPPSMNDYCKYFARIKWQNLQLENKFNIKVKKRTFFEKITSKLTGQHEFYYPLISIWAVLLKTIFKLINKKKIDEIFVRLGPIDGNGDKILSELTRSNSTK